MKVAIPWAKITSAINAGIQKKINCSGTTALIISKRRNEWHKENYSGS